MSDVNSETTDTKDKTVAAEQVVGFLSGNEMSSLAAAQINFHLMGYYPITPSTEVAEYLDEMKAQGKHEVVMVPADGEHGRRRTRSGGHLLWSRNRRGKGVQRNFRKRSSLLAGTAPRAVRHKDTDGIEPGYKVGIRSA